jgi:hypothetical protein
MGLRPAIGQMEEARGDNVHANTDTHSLAEVLPLNKVELPTEQGVHAVETSLEENVDRGQGEQSARDLLPTCEPTHPAPHALHLESPVTSANAPAAHKVDLPLLHEEPRGQGA